MNLVRLLRAARWARRPPSESRVKLVLAIIALCLVLLVIERWIGWPVWATLDGMPRRPF